MSRAKRGEFTAAQRSLRARLAAYRSWERTADAAARTAPARRAAMARFERQVDPDGVLSPEERARRGTAAMRAYFTALALRSSRARAKAAVVKRAAGAAAKPDAQSARQHLSGGPTPGQLSAGSVAGEVVRRG
jgi:hypothetical protein